MNGFYKYLESKGIKDGKNLTIFVRNFLKDPSILFDLTKAERAELEGKLDEALTVFKNKKN